MLSASMPACRNHDSEGNWAALRHVSLEVDRAKLRKLRHRKFGGTQRHFSNLYELLQDIAKITASAVKPNAHFPCGITFASETENANTMANYCFASLSEDVVRTSFDLQH